MYVWRPLVAEMQLIGAHEAQDSLRFSCYVPTECINSI